MKKPVSVLGYILGLVISGCAGEVREEVVPTGTTQVEMKRLDIELVALMVVQGYPQVRVFADTREKMSADDGQQLLAVVEITSNPAGKVWENKVDSFPCGAKKTCNRKVVSFQYTPEVERFTLTVHDREADDKRMFPIAVADLPRKEE